MNKRDRSITIYFHGKSETLLLFPYVYYMIGIAAPYGDAESVALRDEKEIGETILTMLEHCRAADVDIPTRKYNEAHAQKSRGVKVTDSQLLPGFEEKNNWDAICRPYPSLRKGPGSWHRDFTVATLCERDSWKSWQLMHLKRSKYRSVEDWGTSVRIPCLKSPEVLGARIGEYMLAWK